MGRKGRWEQIAWVSSSDEWMYLYMQSYDRKFCLCLCKWQRQIRTLKIEVILAGQAITSSTFAIKLASKTFSKLFSKHCRWPILCWNQIPAHDRTAMHFFVLTNYCWNMVCFLNPDTHCSPKKPQQRLHSS